jgi:cell wall-associated NlpC family hydrolase
VGQLSAPVRIFGLIAVLAAAAMGAFMMTAGRSGTPSSDATLAPLEIEQQAKAAAAKLSAHNKSTAAGKPAAAAPAKSTAKKAVAKPAAAKPAPAPKTKPKPTVHLVKGTPKTIAGQLALHDVVVVLLYNPQAKVDDYSLAEAQLGAKESGAGFLAVDVLDQKQASPFTTAYGVLQDPTTLFFKRPGKLALKLVGYADHDTIAQAARNAALGLGTVASA